MEHTLDSKWITNFDKNDKLYEDYYKDNIYYIGIHFIYINKLYAIEKIREEMFIMSNPNIITREEIIGLIKRNSIDDNKKYQLLSMLKFNITLESRDINSFLREDGNNGVNYLNSIRNIDSIIFDKTINVFQDLNSLIFVFVDKEKVKSNTSFSRTKKKILKPSVKYTKKSR
jgi:hypothetical protein